MRPLIQSLELIEPRSLKHLSDSLGALIEGRLWAKVLLGMLLGIATGVLMGPSVGWVPQHIAEVAGNWLALPGQIFLAAVQMIVVPLVFASIVGGIAGSENVDQLKKLGLSALGFFVVTTTVAICIGIGLAWIIQPGRFIDPSFSQVVATAAGAAEHTGPAVTTDQSIPDAIVGLIPKNPLGVMVEGEMLSIVIFAVVFGIALVSLPVEHADPLLSLLSSLQQVTMTIVRWAMVLAPLAVFGLMAQVAAKLGLKALLGMGVYVATVLLGLTGLLLLYILLVPFITRQKPMAFMRSIREAQLLAFSTSSSAAVMPLSMKIAEDELSIRPSVAQFVIPLGATINMNGTALYQGVAAVFLAQVFQIDLSLSALTLIVVTAVTASIGSPATPGVGMVILSMVLSSVGIPIAGIGLIMGVDRILDMSRTAVNVTGDLLAASALDRFIAVTQPDQSLPPAHPGKRTSVLQTQG